MWEAISQELFWYISDIFTFKIPFPPYLYVKLDMTLECSYQFVRGSLGFIIMKLNKVCKHII